MKAVFGAGNGKVVVTEVQMPRVIEPEDVLIKVAYVGICRDDQRLLEGDLNVHNTISSSAGCGHEMSGTIHDLGQTAKANGFAVGNRVTGHFIHSCGHCHYCKKGLAILCTCAEERMNAMAEYIVWNHRQLFPVPDEIDLRDACLAEPLAACICGIERCDIQIGDRVAILGGGNIGLMMLQLAVRGKASSITVVEPIAQKRALAKKLGADYVINPLDKNIVAPSLKITQSLGFDVVIEATGNSATLKTAVSIAGKRARVLLFSLYSIQDEVSINPFQVYIKELHLLAARPTFDSFNKALIVLPTINTNDLITREYPISQAAEAFVQSAGGTDVKVVVKCT